MIYAPVIIPTLCRYKHFRNCLESLSNCIWSEYTEVYIGLDYPAKESHWEGYNKIRDYLHSCGNLGFKQIHVIERPYNYGFGPNGNLATLRTDILKSYDRFIVSEDDNVFSSNFLVYINRGLEKYLLDKKCFFVCGYNYYGLDLSEYKDNVYFSHEFSAWGYGAWKDKWIENIDDVCSLNFANYIISSWKNIFAIYKYEPRLLNTVMLNLAIGKVFNDTMIVCSQYLNGNYSLFPKISKVRNMGFDNSGTTIFKDDENYARQQIDNQMDFIIDNIDSNINPIIQRQISRFFKRSFFMNNLILIRLFIYKYFKLDICYYVIKKRNRSLFVQTS